jgi:hypothetical protein
MGKQLVRLCGFWIAVAGLVVTPISSAQPNPFQGSWQATYQGIQVTMTMDANMRYQQTLAAAVGQTWQTGHYTVAGGILNLDVDNWEPKTRNVYVPTGTVGGYYLPEANARPAGGTFRYHFDGPDMLTLHDANLGGTITYTRSR